MKLFVSVSAMTLALLTAACSSTPEKVGNEAHGEAKPTTVASIEAKQVAAEQEAAYVVEIQFDPKSVKLDKEAHSKVTSLYRNMAQPDRLKGVKVISWADEEYPSKKDKKLNKTQIELAKQRGEAVEGIIKERLSEQHDKLKFELYNMAKRPGAFSKFVGSEDARIKQSLERAGISTTEDKSKPKAGKAIVMLVMKEGKK